MKNAVILLLISVMPFLAFGQDTTPKKSKHKHKSTKTTKAAVMPPWAAAHNYDATSHVYFPDYYTYYDPNRGGYVFWSDGKYTFTPALPPFLEKVDLGKSRIQILKGLDLNLRPEENYPYYMKQYPADNTNNNGMVPVPIPGNPAGN